MSHALGSLLQWTATRLAGVCLVSMACLGWQAAPWKVIGPGGGGAQYIPTVSPHDPQRVLVACDMTGSYLSRDGGASWRMFNLGEVAREFVWDPGNPKVVYARGNSLHRSEDGGVTWRMVYPPAKAISGVDMSGDHADTTYLMGGKPAARMTAIAVDGRNSKVLYAGIGAEVAVSRDRGITWTVEFKPDRPARRIWTAGGSVYVATDRSVYVRRNGVWREGAPGAAPWLQVAPAGDVIYAVSSSGVEVSSDGGANWSSSALPGKRARVTSVAASVSRPDTAYVGFGGMELEGRTVFGVAKTTDRGRSWQLVWEQGDKAPANVTDAWITPSLGAGWGDEPLTLGTAPSDASICYATDLGRTLKTADGGATWKAVYAHRQGDAWTSSGLDVTTSYGIHVDPFDSKRMLISYTDIGPFRSEDGGQSWQSAGAGIPRRWLNTTYWAVFDPAVRGRVWAVASGTHDLPRPKMWRGRSPSIYRGGVIASTDGGRSWSVSSQGMPETAATHILMDPESPVKARVLYVAAFGRGVYKSTDGGASWVLKNRGISQQNPFVWRLERDRQGGLYAVVARASEDGSIGNALDGAVYYSSDGAETWMPVALPAGVNGPNSITADPRRPGRIYLSAWGRKGDVEGRSGGVFLSEDGGATWSHILRADQHIYDVTVDPLAAGRLYAAGFESAAWRSEDWGRTWRKIAGYDFKWGHRVVVDQANPGMIWITTFGGSVWYGPSGAARTRE